MLTPSSLYQYILDGIDQPYSGYLNPDKANRLIRECTIEAIEARYMSPETQKQNDELSDVIVLEKEVSVRNNRVRTVPLVISTFTVAGTTATISTSDTHQLQVGDTFNVIATEGFTPDLNGSYTVATIVSDTSFTFTVPTVTGTWTQNTGRITHPYMLEDMMHPLAMETTFIGTKEAEISTVTNTGAILTFIVNTIFRTGTRIRITGALGVVGLNGDFYVRSIGRGGKKVKLYTDQELTTQPTLTGTYQGQGKVKLIVTESATKLFPDRRIAPSSDAEEWRPKYGTDTSGFNLYPLESTCTALRIDYIKNPIITIDVADDKTDLEAYYPFKFLMQIKDRCVTSWMLRMRELEMAAPQQQENNANR